MFFRKIKNSSFIKGFLLGILASLVVSFILIKPRITDSKNAIMENGFCYYQPILKKNITYQKLNEQSLLNQCDGQNRVDVGSFQDEDVQKKAMIELYASVNNIKPQKFDDKNIWVISDIHGDIKMLVQGLLKSGLIKWNGKVKNEKFKAYKGKTLTVVYPDVEINSLFRGIYINLGDIVNKNAFGIASLYLLHDIFKKTKDKKGDNNIVKIIIGNHEYYDLLPNVTSAYTETLLNFIDMFDVFYEKNGISFTHAPITKNLKPKNQKEIEYLKSLLVKDDDDFKLKHILYGYEGHGSFPNQVRPSDPKEILSKSVSGHVHGPVDLGYNKRDDVLSVSNERFLKDKSKRNIIFRINLNDRMVYSYFENEGFDLIEKKLNKKLFD